MKLSSIVLFLILLQNSMVLFDFNKAASTENWKTVNDVVMGGRSNSSISLNKENNGVFSGKVSLENNGGFAMTQYYFETLKTSTFSKFIIEVKGDGKTYQFRVKASSEDSHSYIFNFETDNTWQSIEIPFSEMKPKYRGKSLSIDNFTGNQIEMIAFLIGNKKEEIFKLEIKSIKLK
mgnify:CR=1 FL=1